MRRRHGPSSAPWPAERPYRCPTCHAVRPAEHHRYNCAVHRLTPTQRRALLTFRAVPVLERRSRNTWADPTYTGQLVMGGRSDPRTAWVGEETIMALVRAGLVSVTGDRAQLRPTVAA